MEWLTDVTDVAVEWLTDVKMLMEIRSLMNNFMEHFFSSEIMYIWSF